jgi:hypothetical protein
MLLECFGDFLVRFSPLFDSVLLNHSRGYLVARISLQNAPYDCAGHT